MATLVDLHLTMALRPNNNGCGTARGRKMHDPRESRWFLLEPVGPKPVFTEPSVHGFSYQGRHTYRAVAVLMCLCALGCGSGGDLASIGSAPTPLTAARRAPLLLPEVRLGVIPRAGKREFIARLSNPTGRSLRWAVLRTSCTCLSVIAGKNTLEPSDDVLASVSFDGGERSEFVGNVAIEVTALGLDGAEVFRFDVLVEIVPEDEVAFCAEKAVSDVHRHSRMAGPELSRTEAALLERRDEDFGGGPE